MNFSEILDMAVPTPSALVRMTILVVILQVMIAWGIMTTTVFTEGTPVTMAAAEQSLSTGITTSEFPWASIIWTLIALILSAFSGRDIVIDIMALMFTTMLFDSFVKTLGFVLVILLHAHFYGLAERCLRTAVQFGNTRRVVMSAKHKAQVKALKKKLRVKCRMVELASILDVQSTNLQASYRQRIKLQDKQLFTLHLQFSDLQRSNAATVRDFSHYMWCAERTVDSLTGANALLENKLACLEADVQTGHDLYDQFRSDFLCSLRDGETALSHKDAEISSLKQDNAQLVKANQDKDEEIKLPEGSAGHAAQAASGSLHSRWGSAENVPGVSSFQAKRHPSVSTDSSAAVIATAASGTFVSKASRSGTKSVATTTYLDTTADDKAAAEFLIADTALAHWWLSATATSAG
ncbi:hypothetical protein Esi_0702_0001 [Ectocarpus siliculosus]|uniref:Uncharacterized protein n=1 Tax=Ectocarpus siliculosus TaxID=2880 RepID=D7G600_ECTSI|nr:hypothetical protein Esi_0702_0001 [Ectocarpus siliculosus]|eukprot:CBJ33920.1 hypothetical protein Esi_0702_0001 [Ectocarpus siliculosus]